MKILLCPCDRAGCGRYRIGLAASYLQRTESTLKIQLSVGLSLRYDERTGRPLGLAAGFAYDALIVQRPMWEWQIIALRDARKRGIRTVVEVDDDFKALHPLNPAWTTTHPRLSKSHNRAWLGVACREADLVTTTTPALAARYAPHGRVAIVPNYIPEAWLSIEPEPDDDPRLVVGWTGTVGTHQDDLKVTNGGVARAVNEHGARFRVIGHSELVTRDLGLAAEPELVEWQEWETYPHELARFDVGIAPLTDTAFNKAKSFLKPLEMAACGVPCVMSPLPSYQDLYKTGIGVFAKDRERDWRREVGRLLTDHHYRQEFREIGREAAADLTVEGNAYRFAEAWTGAGYPAVV